MHGRQSGSGVRMDGASVLRSLPLQRRSRIGCLYPEWSLPLNPYWYGDHVPRQDVPASFVQTAASTFAMNWQVPDAPCRGPMPFQGSGSGLVEYLAWIIWAAGTFIASDAAGRAVQACIQYIHDIRVVVSPSRCSTSGQRSTPSDRNGIHVDNEHQFASDKISCRPSISSTAGVKASTRCRSVRPSPQHWRTHGPKSLRLSLRPPWSAH